MSSVVHALLLFVLGCGIALLLFRLAVEHHVAAAPNHSAYIPGYGL